MGKAVIVVDMPNGCHDCTVFDHKLCCRIGGRWSQERSRLKGCPLKPMPEKAELTFIDHGQDQIAMGWNACIDAILEGTK